jgi:hypothetical protein
MGRQACRFTLRDVARALKAAAAAGVRTRIDISKEGILSVVPMDETNQPEPETNSADAIVAKLR